MNKTVYKHFMLGSRKSLYMFVYLAKEPSTSPSLGLISIRVKFKYNNVFVNMRLVLNIYSIICLYICKINLYILNIRLCKFINKFLRY